MVMIPRNPDGTPARTGIPSIDARMASPLAPPATPIPTQMPLPPMAAASDPNPSLTAFFAAMQPAGTAPRDDWPTGAGQMPGNLFVNPSQPGSFFIKSNADNGFWSFDPTNKVSAAPIKAAPPPMPASLPPVNLPSSAPMLPPVASLPPAAPPASLPAAPPPPALPAASPLPFDPLAALAAIQSQASPMANPVAGPSLPNNVNQMATMPQVTPIDGGMPSPLAPVEPLPGAPAALPGNPQPGPVQTQTLGESIGQVPGAGGGSAPGLAPGAGGGDATGTAPGLAPPVDEGPQPVLKPNTPTPPTSTLGPNASVEDFLGNLGGLEFGAQGILGVPGGPQRATGQSEADFLRSLISQGLLRQRRPIL